MLKNYPIWHETCFLTGAKFSWIAESWADLDNWLAYPISIYAELTGIHL